MTDYPEQGEEIDNDYHPVDSDLSATEDHWGTASKPSETNVGNIMLNNRAVSGV